MWRGCFAVPFLLAISACTGTGTASLDFSRTVLHSTGTKMGCVAVGELDPDVPGAELVATDERGRVFLIRVPEPGEDAEGRGELLAELGGEAIQCAVGDADYAREGLEIITVGMQSGKETPGGPGRAHLLHRDAEGAWQAEPIFDDVGGLLHAVAIHDGQVFVGGYSNRLYSLSRTLDGWRSDLVAELPGAAKNALPARGGIVVACEDGSLVLVKFEENRWQTHLLHERKVGRARLAAAPDGAILCADDDGSLMLLPVDGEPVRLHKQIDKLRGAWLGDLDPAWPGLEAVTAGYGRRVTLLRDGGEAGWSTELIREEGERIHHVAGGELDGRPGPEIVTAGFAGEVVLFRTR